jgi:hypothetical protein
MLKIEKEKKIEKVPHVKNSCLEYIMINLNYNLSYELENTTFCPGYSMFAYFSLTNSHLNFHSHHLHLLGL